MSPYLDPGLRAGGGRGDAGLLRLDVEPDYSDLVLGGHRLVARPTGWDRWAQCSSCGRGFFFPRSLTEFSA